MKVEREVIMIKRVVTVLVLVAVGLTFITLAQAMKPTLFKDRQVTFTDVNITQTITQSDGQYILSNFLNLHHIKVGNIDLMVDGEFIDEYMVLANPNVNSIIIKDSGNNDVVSVVNSLNVYTITLNDDLFQYDGEDISFTFPTNVSFTFRFIEEVPGVSILPIISAIIVLTSIIVYIKIGKD